MGSVQEFLTKTLGNRKFKPFIQIFLQQTFKKRWLLFVIVGFFFN